MTCSSSIAFQRYIIIEIPSYVAKVMYVLVWSFVKEIFAFSRKKVINNILKLVKPKGVNKTPK